MQIVIQRSPIDCVNAEAIITRLSFFVVFSILCFFVCIAAPKRFLLPHPQDEELPPTPVRLFPRRSEIAPGSNDSKNATDEAAEPVAACEYCLQARCITSSPFKPQGRSNARITNHTKRRKDYRWYWRTLKDCGLWENTIYLAHQQELGCLIDDVREVMPHCVIKDVRGRWPNPSDVPYQGHR